MNTIQHYCTNPDKIARELARIAVRALYFEVKSHPKPGLVSFICKGAHDDMHGATFYRSLFTLRHYFYHVVMKDKQGSHFIELKQIAKQAEADMLVATGGVNTHRGAIFALGIVCVSVARLASTKATFLPQDLQQQLILDWQRVLAEHESEPHSHGAQVINKYQVNGAKAMAMQGYDIVFQVLNDFLLLYNKTQSLDSCCLYAYAQFLSHIDDTNIIYRKELDGLVYARQYAKKLLAITTLQDRHHYGLEVHQLFSKNHISPGGVGDLIGVLLFVSQLFSEKLRCHV